MTRSGTGALLLVAALMLSGCGGATPGPTTIGTGGAAGNVSLDPSGPMPTVTGLVVTLRGGRIRAAWVAPTGATGLSGYDVYIGSAAPVRVKRSPYTAAAALSPGRSALVQVVARYGSVPSGPVSATVTAPDAPVTTRPAAVVTTTAPAPVAAPSTVPPAAVATTASADVTGVLDTVTLVEMAVDNHPACDRGYTVSVETGSGDIIGLATLAAAKPAAVKRADGILQYDCRFRYEVVVPLSQAAYIFHAYYDDLTDVIAPQRKTVTLAQVRSGRGPALYQSYCAACSR